MTVDGATTTSSRRRRWKPERATDQPARPENRRDRRRRRSGRAAATIAAAAALVGAFPIVTAEPASAYPGCWGSYGWFWNTSFDCYYDEYIWAVVGGTFLNPPPAVFLPIATPTVALSKEAGDAIMVAEQAIQDPACNELISQGLLVGDPEYATAQEVLTSRKTSSTTIAEMPGKAGPDGQPPRPAATKGVGVLSTTTLYEEFYKPVFRPEDYERQPADGPLRAPELQVLIVLHETAHATGALPEEKDGKAPGDFNSRIIEDCLGLETVNPPRATEPAPPPPPPPPPPEQPPPSPRPRPCTRPPCPYTQPEE